MKEVCKRVLFPLLSLLSRTFQQLEFKEMFYHDNTKEIINGILKDKKIILNKNSYNSIIRIMENNNEIINNIREIYRTAPANKIHQLIAKHFIPSIEEKKNNAEIPTPIELVNEMLSKMPEDFWKTPKKVFEPCCGKGNFVMKIFEKFYIGLQELYPNVNERCKIIITQCLYFGDLTQMNVFITLEILKCDIQSKTGIEEINYAFNAYSGDTLELDVKKIFNIDVFDAIIGNPPYEDVQATGDNKLYLSFIQFSLKKLKEAGLLLFITPINVKNYITVQNKNRNYIDNLYNIKFLSLNTANKYFQDIGNFFSYFVIEKTIVEEVSTNIEFVRQNIVEKDIITIRKGYNIPLCCSKKDITIINKVSNLICDNHTVFDIKKAMYDNDGKHTYQRIRKQHIKDGIVVDKKTEEHKYMIIDKVTKTHKFPGIKYFYNKQMIDYGKSKTIMCTGGYLSPEFDDNGEYNLSDNMIYMLSTRKEYEAFKIIINSKIIEYLNKISMTDGLHGRDKVIMSIKKIDLNDIYNDADIYNLYNISEDEQKIIDITIGKANTIYNALSNDLQIIQKGRGKYYLVDNKLYKINKNKSQGDFYCDYIEVKPTKVIKKKSIIEPMNEIQPIINNQIIETIQDKPKKVKKKSIIEPINNELNVSNVDIIVKTPIKRKNVKKNIISSNNNNITI